MNRVSSIFVLMMGLVLALVIVTMKCNITTTTGTPESISREASTTGTPESKTQDVSDVNSLKSLILSGNGSWNPEFKPKVLKYTYTVTDTIESITITPRANSKKSKITINDKEFESNEVSVPISPSVGRNEIAIQVIAENGDVREYTIIVEHRAPGVIGDDKYLNSLTLSGNGTWDREFKPDILNYSYEVPNTVESITLTPTANSKKSEILINGLECGSNEESEPIFLRVGRSEIVIQVTMENGDVREYIIIVERLVPGVKKNDDKDNDNSLKSLFLSGNGSLDPKFKPEVFKYSYKVQNTVKSITLTPRANSKKSKITVNGEECRSGEKSKPISLKKGRNEITIQVIPENGSEQKYTVMAEQLAEENSIVVAKTTLVCVGNSNCRRAPRDGENFVTLLAEMLGNNYEVRNFGVDGATMVRGNRNYMKFGADFFKQIFEIKPDIITVMLGTNDAKPGCWKKNGKFYEADAQAMVDTLLTISPKPRLLLVFPPKAFKNKYSISDNAITNEQVPILRAIAKKAGIETIDVNTPTDSSGYFGDGVHFSVRGTELLAEIYYESITK